MKNNNNRTERIKFDSQIEILNGKKKAEEAYLLGKQSIEAVEVYWVFYYFLTCMETESLVSAQYTSWKLIFFEFIPCVFQNMYQINNNI